jgi:uncharacterized protein (TIGR02421 family)
VTAGDHDDGLVPGDLAIDRELADIALGYRFLLDVTPVDLVEIRRRFLDDGTPPELHYRPLEDDVTVVAGRLANVDTQAVEDATLAHLVQAKQREIELQLEMLRCRGSTDFLALSIELYGAVSPSLLATAETLLDEIEVAPPERPQAIDAATFAQRAEAELDHYRRALPDLDIRVVVRDDGTGVMFANGVLLVASTTRVATSRVHALLQHEVGTHVVTYVNGTCQPLRLLAAGLAGYDETQEGLAVLAEHLAGGLTAGRLRQVAARVVAVHRMVEGASFAEVHRTLVDAGVHPDAAFSIAIRVFRAGGLTKDAVYLRGLLDIVDHVRNDGDLDVLWLGKMALADAPLVDELRARGVLHEPTLRPRYLDDPALQARLDHARAPGSLADLLRTPA